MMKDCPVQFIWLALVVLMLHAGVVAREPVLTGIDVLQRDEFKQLSGQRIGLVTNHTGRNAEGAGTVQLLHDAENVSLVALFSPEHGFEGKLDVAKIGDATDGETGLKIFSLYGSTRRPTAEMLQGVDTIVFDIQDIGSRFYTYVSTMGEVMHAAAQHHKPFVVLDRPNPINGLNVSGPMLDSGKESFVGFHSLPVRHGMTIGELAMMFRSELKLDLDLTVVQCEGWQRSYFWDQTGLTWVNPSPNMRCLTQALLYPGMGLMETTNVSVGRGTDTPFEILGAPWIDGRKLAAELRDRRIPGVTFVPIEFTPDDSKFKGELCGGINVIITDRAAFQSLRTGFEVAMAVQKLYPHSWTARSYLRLLGNQATLEAIVGHASTADLLKIAAVEVDDFLLRRKTFLLYE